MWECGTSTDLRAGRRLKEFERLAGEDEDGEGDHDGSGGDGDQECEEGWCGFQVFGCPEEPLPFAAESELFQFFPAWPANLLSAP